MSRVCGAFDFVADAHAARAEDAAIVIQAEEVVGSVERELGIAIGNVDVRDAHCLSEALQFAVSVGDADGADVIALGEEHLDDHAPVALQAGGIGGDVHPFGDFGHAGGEELVDPLTSTRQRRQAPHPERPSRKQRVGTCDFVFFADVEDGLVGASADVVAVDFQGMTTVVARSLDGLLCAAATGSAGGIVGTQKFVIFVAEIAKRGEDGIGRAWPRPQSWYF